MSYNDGNPYYSPESLGLEIVATIERDMSYEFDMLIVWRKLDDGTFYWQQDRGCSCPTPFEDYESIESLNTLDFDDRASLDALESSVRAYFQESGKPAPLLEAASFISALQHRDYLKAKEFADAFVQSW